jgi:hypothetical protein
MNNNALSIGDMASALGGAGLTQITTNLDVALILIGAGVLLKIVVAVLQKQNLEVSG